MSAKSMREDTDRIVLSLVLELLPITLDQHAKTHIQAHYMVLLLSYAGANIGYGPVQGFNDFRGPNAFKLVTSFRDLAKLMAEDPDYLKDLVAGAAVMLKPALAERIRKAARLFTEYPDVLVHALRYGYATVVLQTTVEEAYQRFQWQGTASGHEQIAAADLISKLLEIRDAA